MIIRGIELVLSFKDPLPLRGFPKGRVRIRQRKNQPIVIYIKTDTGIQSFLIKEKRILFKRYWVPAIREGSNEKM